MYLDQLLIVGNGASLMMLHLTMDALLFMI
uniref:Uncharacterized protein n=1 Tax=Amphimedon queenslandica TaxID=400682 RepID=A0A1X7UVP9_AMPQE